MPRCSGSQDPEDAIQNTAVVHPSDTARLVRQHWLNRSLLKVGEFIAHDSTLQFGGLNHSSVVDHNITSSVDGAAFPSFPPESESATRAVVARHKSCTLALRRRPAEVAYIELRANMAIPVISIVAAQTSSDLEDVRSLFLEYVASLDVDLSFQGFEQEQATLPGKYGPPKGTLFLARTGDGRAIGVAGVRPFDWPRSCEMKRLYVRPEDRGIGAGRMLAECVIAFATAAGYSEMLLDSLPNMRSAIRLYRLLGFREISPYWNNTVPGILYFSKQLR